MRKTTIISIILLAIAGFGHKAVAQDQPSAQQAAPAEHFYRLDFVVEDLNADGKVVNSRSYSTAVSTNAHGRTVSIRSGSKIPFATGSYSGGDGKEGTSPLVNTQYQYEDVGADIDVRDAHDVSGQLAFNLTAVLSSVAANTDPNLHEPVIRQDKWEAFVLVPIGKQSVVCKSDSADSKGSTRVLVTATAMQ